MKKTRRSKKWIPKIWIPKEGLRVTFKDRKPRALCWRKALYIEWYEYAKLSGKYEDNTYPKEFGDLDSKELNTAEKWWRHPKYGFELFCEPYVERSVDVVKKPKEYNFSDTEISVKVDLNRSRRQIALDFRLLLERYEKRLNEEYISQARFLPSKPMRDIRLFNAEYEHNEKGQLPIRLCFPRDVYIMYQEGLSRDQIAYKMGWFHKDEEINNSVYEYVNAIKGRLNKGKFLSGKTNSELDTYSLYDKYYDAALMRVSRNKKRCLEIFKNIKRRTFP